MAERDLASDCHAHAPGGRPREADLDVDRAGAAATELGHLPDDLAAADSPAGDESDDVEGGGQQRADRDPVGGLLRRVVDHGGVGRRLAPDDRPGALQLDLQLGRSRWPDDHELADGAQPAVAAGETRTAQRDEARDEIVRLRRLAKPEFPHHELMIKPPWYADLASGVDPDQEVRVVFLRIRYTNRELDRAVNLNIDLLWR